MSGGTPIATRTSLLSESSLPHVARVLAKQAVVLNGWVGRRMALDLARAGSAVAIDCSTAQKCG